MLWFVFALSAALISAGQNLVSRKVMLKSDPYAYAFLENGLTLLLFIPLAILAWELPTEAVAWLITAAAGIIWSVISVIIMFSYKHTKVSLRAPVSESRSFWVLLFAALFLAEAITAEKVIGVTVIFIGIMIVTYRKGAQFGSLKDKGVQLTLLSALLLALVSILDKKALAYFTPNVYAVFVYLIPTVSVGAYALAARRTDVQGILTSQKLLLAGLVILGAGAYYFQLQAINIAEVSVVFPILRLSTMFTVIGGIIFFHERDHIMRKIIATLIVVAGVVLVSGYYTLF